MQRANFGMALPGLKPKSAIKLSGNEVVLELSPRKNKPRGGKISRKCVCKSTPECCPVHIMWPFFESFPSGHQPFGRLNMGSLLMSLRRRLTVLGVDDPLSYRTHDFRRGHARDLQYGGGGLREILEAGEWSSPAFLKYFDVCDLERDVVLQAHIDDSSDDEFESCSVIASCHIVLWVLLPLAIPDLIVLLQKRLWNNGQRLGCPSLYKKELI